jgi:hypothetical protein
LFGVADVMLCYGRTSMGCAPRWARRLAIGRGFWYGSTTSSIHEAALKVRRTPASATLGYGRRSQPGGRAAPPDLGAAIR